MNQEETYYLKAVSNYPFDYNEVCESLNYALSYNPGYAPALCLKAKIYMHEKTNLALAKSIFEQALISDPNHIDSYQYYGQLLLQIEEYESLERLIDKSFKVMGINKTAMYLLRAKLYERQKNLNKALLTLDIATEECYNIDMEKIIEEERKRMESKADKKNGKTNKKRILKKDLENIELTEIK
jgi:tetratricopeptide (TPR) repeat protein